MRNVLHENPRTRLLRSGAASLSGAELLAVCLGGDDDDLELVVHLLGRFDSPQAVLAAPAHALLATAGLGATRVARLQAIHELSVRPLEAELRSRSLTPLNDSDTVRRYVARQLARCDREVFACLFLDTRHRLLRFEQLFFGSVDRAHVHPRIVLKRAIEVNAATPEG